MRLWLESIIPVGALSTFTTITAFTTGTALTALTLPRTPLTPFVALGACHGLVAFSTFLACVQFRVCRIAVLSLGRLIPLPFLGSAAALGAAIAATFGPGVNAFAAFRPLHALAALATFTSLAPPTTL